MVNKEKIIRYFKASGDEELASRLLDLAAAAAKTGRYKVSEFLDPHGLNIAEIIAANFENMRLDTLGGFTGAERQRAAFIAKDYMGTVDFGLAAFQITWDQRYYQIGHRDILGAFMGLGCKREILGDIILVPSGAQLVCAQELAPYVQTNLVKIGAAAVLMTPMVLEDLQVKEEKVKVIKATVAALRLDAVAAAGYGTSRSRMADEIKGKNVKINWKEAKNAAQTVNAGDVLSFRGRGRVEVTEVRGVTKKGRMSIVLKRYI